MAGRRITLTDGSMAAPILVEVGTSGPSPMLSDGTEVYPFAFPLISRTMRRDRTFRTSTISPEPTLAKRQRHFPFSFSTDQQPRQMDLIILSTFASSRSMTGLVPPSGPF